MAAGVSPRLEAPPGGGVGSACALGFGVPQAGGVGRDAVAFGQIWKAGELMNSGRVGGHGDLG